MRIGLYHGYELTGSGSNEYTRYLSRALASRGHEVHVICREPDPDSIEHVDQAFAWTTGGRPRELFQREKVGGGGRCVLHQLAESSVQPVFLADKQRSGNVKEFPELTDEELLSYHNDCVGALTAILKELRLDLLHANHTVYQPVVAAEACPVSSTPFLVFPHGSAIEYVLRRDERFADLAHGALLAADGMVTGNREVRDRILDLYPASRDRLAAKSHLVGVGVDTDLFAPIPRRDRARHLRRAGRDVPAGGKQAEQSAALRERLAAGEWGAVADYRAAYDQSQPDEDALAKLDGVTDADRILLFVGALTAGKGLQSVIAALPSLFATSPETRLVVVGSGRFREVLEALVYAIASRDEALLEALVACDLDVPEADRYPPFEDIRRLLDDPDGRARLLSQGPEFMDRVLFVGRFDHERLRHLFPCADLSIFPSVVPEAYPLVLMESLANGVLPVVTDFSGFTDALDELESVLGKNWVDRMRLPATGDRVPGIAARLQSLLVDPELSGLAPTLRAVAVEQYDWNVRAAAMEAVYAKIAALAEAKSS